MTLAARTARARGARDAGTEPSRRRPDLGWLGLAPFSVYVVLFLLLPAALAVGSGFFTRDGAFTLANLAAFGNPIVLKDFLDSFWLSAVTAVLGAVFGATICYALLRARPDGLLRSVVDAGSSVLAQFGGVMLAFAWIATIGSQGLVTVLVAQLTGIESLGGLGGPSLYTVAGLIPVYLYFQVPLMVLSFMPAMEGLRQAWAEAAATLGATRATYWRRIAMPILAPAFFGCAILLFANAFSSFATAAALIDQGGIVPLRIFSSLSSETVLGADNLAGVLALGMVVVMVVLMAAYGLLQRRAARWQR